MRRTSPRACDDRSPLHVSALGQKRTSGPTGANVRFSQEARYQDAAGQDRFDFSGSSPRPVSLFLCKAQIDGWALLPTGLKEIAQLF